jgi:hypothetical protein
VSQPGIRIALDLKTKTKQNKKKNPPLPRLQRVKKCCLRLNVV